MGPQDPKDVTRDTARDLSGVVKELAALNGDAHHWLEGPEYATLKHRLEDAHAAVEAAPERTHVKNNRNRAITIKTVGSIYRPYSYEPFRVDRRLGAASR